jgi:Zn-finger nucleic acid-binding protein
LYASTHTILEDWTERLRREAGEFPEKVTAFRPDMAVHGKYGEPCPRCGKPVQRIRYADNESNYCPTCQTEGKLLADRSLSRLMRGDWPKTLEELEAKKDRNRTAAAPAGSFAARAASFIPSRPTEATAPEARAPAATKPDPGAPRKAAKPPSKLTSRTSGPRR